MSKMLFSPFEDPPSSGMLDQGCLFTERDQSTVTMTYKVAYRLPQKDERSSLIWKLRYEIAVVRVVIGNRKVK